MIASLFLNADVDKTIIKKIIAEEIAYLNGDILEFAAKDISKEDDFLGKEFFYF